MLKNLKLFLAGSMAASSGISAASALSYSNIVMAKENDIIITTENYYKDGVTYKEGVFLVGKDYEFNRDDETKTLTFKDNEGFDSLTSGSIIVFGKADIFKIDSISRTEGNVVATYTIPNNEEFIKGIDINSSEKTVEDYLNELVGMPEKMEDVLDIFENAGISKDFIGIIRDVVDELDKAIDADEVNELIQSGDKAAMEKYLDEINKVLEDEGYDYTIQEILDQVYNLDYKELEEQLKNLSEEDVKEINKYLDTFAEIITDESLTEDEKMEKILSIMEDIFGNIETPDIDVGGGDKEQPSNPSDETTGNNGETSKTEVGDFSGIFTITSIPSTFDGTTLRTHMAFSEEIGSHSFAYYPITVKDKKGGTFEMMCDTTEENINFLKSYQAGTEVMVYYTVSECTKGDYDYRVTKLEKVNNGTNAETGGQADTGLKNNSIYYALALVAATLGIGYIVISKKKQTK